MIRAARAVLAEARGRLGVQALGLHRVAAQLAHAVGAGVDARERIVDRVLPLGPARAERERVVDELAAGALVVLARLRRDVGGALRVADPPRDRVPLVDET